METESSKEAIKKAISIASSNGYSPSPELAKSIGGLENPTYRVAVVGKFQVGKSTLINKVFLGDNTMLPCLSEGNGEQCQTAVATDMEYGEVSKLEIYNWKETGGEELVSSKENPTADDVKAATVVGLKEENRESKRTELAKKVSRVRLITPNEALKGYVVLDTPGLDDPNRELLLNTTYRIIPSADVALLVVTPRMLDQIEEGLIHEMLIGKGVSKLMVLVSYNPESMHLGQQKRCEVLETIKAQLGKIGRGDIPVKMYCFDSSVEDLNVSDTSELQLQIRSFLTENALPGRLARVAFEVRQYLEDIELEIAAKIKAIGSSEAERAALQNKVEGQIAEFKAQCEKSFRRLQAEMEELKEYAAQRSNGAVRSVFAQLVQKMEDAPDVNAIHKVLKNAEDSVRDDLTDRIGTICREVKVEIEAIVDRYAQNLTDVMNAWNRILLDDFSIERPFVAKIPPILFDGVMIAIWNYFLPFGWLTAILAHIIGKKTFGLNPAIILKPILLSQAKGKIAEAETQIGQRISDQISTNVNSAFFNIKEALETYNQGEVEKMRKMVVCEEVSSDRAELEKAKAEVSAAIQSLR